MSGVIYKSEDNYTIIIPESKEKLVKIILDYGNCPKCDNKLINYGGRYALWENNIILDEFDSRYCMNCKNTWFLNGKGDIEFTDKEMIYTNNKKILKFKLIPLREINKH